MGQEMFVEKSVDTGEVTEFHSRPDAKDMTQEETREETFSGAMEKDVAAAQDLVELKHLVVAKQKFEKKRGNTGIDESGTNFAEDIVRAIDELEQKVQRGENVTDQDIRRVTSAYGIRTRTLDLLKIKRIDALIH